MQRFIATESKIHIGKNAIINYSAIILDMDDVYIGKYVRIGSTLSSDIL